MKKISVITVCKNSEDTIAMTIESVLSQNYPNVEHIIVDGQSTDNTLKIVESYKREHPEIFKVISEEDRNMTEALNKGWKMATGDIIGFLNSDDVYVQGALEAVEKAFTEYSNPDFVVGNCIFIKNVKIISKAIPRVIALHLLYIIGNYIPHPAVFFNKTVSGRIGYYDETFKFAMDLDYWVRALKSKLRFKYLDKDIAYFTLSERQLSTRYSKFVHEEVAKIFNNKRYLLLKKMVINLGLKEKTANYYGIKNR